MNYIWIENHWDKDIYIAENTIVGNARERAVEYNYLNTEVLEETEIVEKLPEELQPIQLGPMSNACKRVLKRI